MTDKKPEQHKAPARPQRAGKGALLPSLVGGILLLAAFAGGFLVNLSDSAPEASPTPEPEPEVVATAAPTPSPTPKVSSIRLFAFGRELDEDGFTAYVGDKPFTLSIEPEPAVRRPQVTWSILDSRGSHDSAALSPSDDGLSCEFTALKPTGRNELTVRCFGAEVTIPVFLWER